LTSKDDETDKNLGERAALALIKLVNDREREYQKKRCKLQIDALRVYFNNRKIIEDVEEQLIKLAE
jgi:hypothetical protein